jgi:glycosyltransferase involved in cell wall biosynthesis
VLVLTGGSSIFIDRVTDALTPALQGEIRTMAFTDLLSPDERPTRRAVLEMRYALSTTGRRTPAPPALAQQLDWADVVLVEWASLEFAWFSLLDRPQVRTIVRLHRYEAMTLYPQLADMARIDAVLFIAEHVANLVRGTAPRLAAVPWTGVIPNLHDLSAFRTKKKEGASRTLVQVVWDRAVKDVGYALDVLEVVRREDPSWKLMLVGRTAEETAPGSSYAKESMARISEFGDAVEILGRRDDIPEVLTGAGFLISSSLHEGSHESVAEGAAAGCVPVVRNWPQAQPWGGAYGQYPTSWIVEGPTDAAARILSIAESARSSAEGSEAHTWILAARDRAAITRRYRDLVLHPPRES